MSTEVAFGQWLKLRRKELDLTQDELASSVGCSVVLIQKIETGERRPSKQIAELLAGRLHVPPDEGSDFVRFARSKRVSRPSTESTPWRALRRQLTNLPVQPTSLIGRQQQVQDLRDKLLEEPVRLITLTGPPGVGKTRLAIHVAFDLLDEFEDGVFLVPLAPISDSNLVIASIARSVGIQEVGSQPLSESVKDYLVDKRLLLLLDNFEQVVMAAPCMAELLATCPWLKILVTSRVSLHLRAERQFHVSPLGFPPLSSLPACETLLTFPAVALFAERAQAVAPEFAVTTANAQSIAEICARLDGLPLAIELVAARIDVIPPLEMSARLSHGLSLSSDGPSDMPARHQNLRNAIDWSFNLLDPAERALLVRLAVFAGGFERAAAQEVTGAVPRSPDTTLSAGRDGLALLVDKNLLLCHQEIEPRFSMLETIREYSSERLVASGEADEIRRMHALYFLGLAELAQSHLQGPQQVDWINRFDREHNNFRAALRWSLEQGESEIALRMSSALWRFWRRRGYLGEGLAWLKATLQSTRAEPGIAIAEYVQRNPSLAAARENALMGAGWLFRDASDFEQMKILFEESLALCRELGDTSEHAYALYSVGYAEFLIGDHQRGIRDLEASLALYREAEDRQGIAMSLAMLGQISVGLGDYAQAKSYLTESLGLNRNLGEIYRTTTALGDLGELAICQGDYVQAGSYLEESQHLLDKLGEKQLTTWVLTKRGELAWCQGDLSHAQAFLETAVQLSTQIGYRWNSAYSLSYLGMVMLSEGDVERAQELCESSLSQFKVLGIEMDIARVTKNLAQIMSHRHDYVRATALYGECLPVFKKLGFKPDIIECLEGMGSVRSAQGDPKTAVRLLGAAHATREVLGVPIPPVLQMPYDSVLAMTRRQLGDPAFAVAWRASRALTLEQAVELVLTQSNSLESAKG